MKKWNFAFICLAITGCSQSSLPPSPPVSSDVTANKPELPIDAADSGDTLQVNEQERDRKARLPVDQSEDRADAEITGKIWQRVTNNTELSSEARACKINVEDGYVTLRGRVQSEDEKNQMEKIAIEVAGAEKVSNQLEIQSPIDRSSEGK